MNNNNNLNEIRKNIENYKNEKFNEVLGYFNKSNYKLLDNVEYKKYVVIGRVATPYKEYRGKNKEGYNWLCDLLGQWTKKGVKTTNSIVLQLVEEFNYFYDSNTIAKFIDLSIKKREAMIREALNSANTIKRGATERGGNLYEKGTKTSVMGFIRALEICLNDKVTITYTEAQREALQRAKEERVAKAKATKEAKAKQSKKTPNKAKN